MKDIIAGYATQVRQLKKRLQNLDMDKVDSLELKNTLDSLREIETRLSDAKKAKVDRKKAREDKQKEMEKESVESTRELTPPGEAPQTFEKPEYFLHQKRPPIKPHVIKDVPSPIDDTKVEGAEDQLPGGLGDKKKDFDFDKKELAKGVKVELEHTSNIDLAKEIAKDHLMEDPKYYTTLETIHTEEVEKEAVVDKFSLDDMVEPATGTPGSMGQVMRYDADRDMVYVKWNEGKLSEDHGFGAYSSNDLRKRASFKKNADNQITFESLRDQLLQNGAASWEANAWSKMAIDNPATTMDSRLGVQNWQIQVGEALKALGIDPWEFSHGKKEDDLTNNPHEKAKETIPELDDLVDFEASKKRAVKTTKCIKCDKSMPVKDMVKNVHGAGYLCKEHAKEWNKDSSKTLGLSKLADDDIDPYHFEEDVSPPSPAPTVKVEAPTMENLKDLLARAADVLQDYRAEVDGDYNDPLAMEIYEVLKTLPEEPAEDHIDVAMKKITKLLTKIKKKADNILQGPDMTFFEYCWKFYAPGEMHGDYFDNKLTPEDLKAAIAQQMKTPNFEGDSVDREAVRDILMADQKYKNTAFKMKAEGNKEDAAKDALSNDEASSDEELVVHFIQELKMSPEEAKQWVSKRDHYLQMKDLPASEKEADIDYKEARGVPLSLFNAETAPEVVEALKIGINAPFVNSYSSTLGGDKNISILLTVALDPKESWENNILENSTYGKYHISNDGTVEYFSGPLRIRRKTVKDVDSLIMYLNQFFEKSSVPKEEPRQQMPQASKKVAIDPSEDPASGYGGNRPGVWVSPKTDDRVSIETDDELPADEMIDADDMLPIEPAEDDIVIATEGPLGGKYHAYQSGKEIASAVEWDDIENQIRKHMKSTNWYPEVWFQDDHGGIERTTIASKKKIARRLLAGFVEVGGRKFEYIPQYDLSGGMVPLVGYQYTDDTGQKVLELKTDRQFSKAEHQQAIWTEYLDKVTASKNEKVGMNFKHILKLAIECPDCYKKFLKFASERGTTIVIDKVKTTIEQLKQKIADTRKRLDSKASHGDEVVDINTLPSETISKIQRNVSKYLQTGNYDKVREFIDTHNTFRNLMQMADTSDPDFLSKLDVVKKEPEVISHEGSKKKAKTSLEVGDRVTTKIPEEGYYSNYGGNPEIVFNPGDVGVVINPKVPKVRKSSGGDFFVLVEFEQHGKPQRVGMDLINLEKVVDDVEKEAQTPPGPPPQDDPGTDMEWFWDGAAWIKKQKGDTGMGMGTGMGVTPLM